MMLLLVWLLWILLWGAIFVSGIRIVRVAKPGVDPEKLKKVAGIKNLTAAQVGGWIAILLGGLIVLRTVMSILALFMTLLGLE